MKKRIAVIGLKGLPAFGGAAAVGESIIKGLSDEFDFTVYSVESHVVDPEKSLIKQIVFKTSKIKPLNIIFYYLKSAFHVLFKGKYDLIHLHHIDAAFILLIIRLKYKVISTNHGVTYLHAKWSKITYPYFRINELLQLNLSNKITLVAKHLLEHYANSRFVNKLEYIPNGVYPVNLSKLKPEGHESFDLSFAAGRIIATKGLHTLIHALGDSMTLRVMGNLSHSVSYQSQINQLSKEKRIQFDGLIFDKNELFSRILNSRCFVFPSSYEAMSMMLLEVASIGIPIICSDIIQNTDIFSEDEVLFFKNENVADLNEKIEYALTNADQMKKKAINAKLKVENKYHWDNICLQYKNDFNALINTD